GRGVSRDPVYDGGFRHARRSHACKEDGRLDAGGSKEWFEQDAPHLIKDRIEGRAWHGEASHETDRRIYGRVLIPVLAIGSEGVECPAQNVGTAALGCPAARPFGPQSLGGKQN